MINFDFPQFVPKKKKEEPLFIPIDQTTQTSTPAYLPSQPKTSTLSNFLPSLSESARKLTAGGFKGLFSKEPTPTWKEAIKEKHEWFTNPETSPLYTTAKINGKEQRVLNPLTFLSTEPLKKIAVPIAKNLTTKFLEYAKSKTTLSRQEIMDFARRPELKKGEADLLNKLAKDLPEGKLPAQEFTDSIHRDLLELKPVKVKEPQYGGVQIYRQEKIPQGKNYEEVVYESPITTNGSSHYPNSKNYFAHTRGDEVVEGGKKIWREQEIQSDLLQKENLENMFATQQRRISSLTDESDLITTDRFGNTELAPKGETATQLQKSREKLTPFTNDRFGERIMRERIKEKAQKGYGKYRLPTGETIGKIEGFGAENNWMINLEPGAKREPFQMHAGKLTPDKLKVGLSIDQSGEGYANSDWIITDILGDGRFKAISFKDKDLVKPVSKMNTEELFNINKYAETFDLTGKSNPQYRRYSDWGKFLKNKFGGKEITDPQGNSWMEIDLKKEMGKFPIEAFGVGAIPFMPQVQQLFVPQDEKKNKTSTPFMLKEKGNFEYNAPKEQKFPSLKKGFNDMIGVETATEKEIKLDEPTTQNTIGGYNFSKYATKRDAIPVMKQIYNQMQVFDFQSAQKEINRISQINKLPTDLKADMIFISAKKYNVEPKIIMTVIQKETTMGTNLLSKNNFGNIGNTDEKVKEGKKEKYQSYNTPQDGVDAVARELQRREINGFY